MLRASLVIAAATLLSAGAARAQSGLNTVFKPSAPSTALSGPRNDAGPAGFPVPASELGSTTDPDPYEKLNRKSYALFRYLDRVAIRPSAVFYAHAVPHLIRKGIHNGLQNLGEPVIFFNDVVQLHPKAAGQTLGRFAVNSTFGIAGIADVATNAGLPYHENGFGTTLGRYGVPPGPFLFIPVVGPSDVRDLFGSGVDSVSDPLTWINYSNRWAFSAGRTVLSGLDTRVNADPQLKQIESMATDPYATLRSLYLQNRQAQVEGGQVNVNDLPDFGPADGAPNEAGTTPSAPEPAIGPAGAAAALPSQTAPTTAQPATPPATQPTTPPEP